MVGGERRRQRHIGVTRHDQKLGVRSVFGPLSGRNQTSIGCAIAAAAWQLQSGIKGACRG